MSTTDEPAAEDDTESAQSTTAEPVSTTVQETVDATVAALRPHWIRLLWRLSYRLSLVCICLLVFVLGKELWQQHRLAAAGAAGQRAAVDYAQVLTSIDSDKVDDDFAAVLNGATGDFKDTYTKASGALRQLLIDNKASAQGVVVDSAVQSESKDKVVVLLMVNQTVTNTTRPDPRVDRSRMKMTMQKVDGRWLASKVELP